MRTLKQESWRVLLLSSAASAVILASPALAQDTQSASQPAPATAANTDVTPGGGLEEIVVTARKRAENLQDVSSSVSALSAGELARRFDSDVRDFADASPNVIID